MIHVRLIPIDIRQMDRTYSPPQRFFALLPSSISISYGHVPILTLFYVSRTQSQSFITSTHPHVPLLQPLPYISTSPPLNSSPLIYSNPFQHQPLKPAITRPPRSKPKTLRYNLRKENEKRKYAPRVSHSSPPSHRSTDPIERGRATNRVLHAEASLLRTTSSSSAV